VSEPAERKKKWSMRIMIEENFGNKWFQTAVELLEFTVSTSIWKRWAHYTKGSFSIVEFHHN
jgi:hypothetical protein